MSRCNKCGRSHDSWGWLCPTCQAIEEHERVEVETREHQAKLADEREVLDRERDERREELLAEQAQLQKQQFEREQEQFEREQEQREAAEEAAERRAEEQRAAWEEQADARRHDLANAHCLQAERMREQAELKLRAGMVKDAIARLRKALELDDANYRIYETLSEAYEAAGGRAEWEESVRSRLAWLPHSEQAHDGASYARLLRDCGKAEDLLRKCRALISTQAASIPMYAAYGGLLAELAAHRLIDDAMCLLDALPQRLEARSAGLIQGVFTPIAPYGELRSKFTAAVTRIVGMPFDTLCGLLKQMVDAGWMAEGAAIASAGAKAQDTLSYHLLAGVMQYRVSSNEDEVRDFAARLARVPTAELHLARQQMQAALDIVESSVGVPEAFRRVLAAEEAAQQAKLAAEGAAQQARIAAEQQAAARAEAAVKGRALFRPLFWKLYYIYLVPLLSVVTGALVEIINRPSALFASDSNFPKLFFVTFCPALNWIVCLGHLVASNWEQTKAGPILLFWLVASPIVYWILLLAGAAEWTYGISVWKAERKFKKYMRSAARR